MNLRPKIVVVTPVKNEAWILNRFLSVTSQFADHIIIADQNSTDESVAICEMYPKVTLIKNRSNEYDEGIRQNLLIQKARELVTDNKIILALDADEILAANAMQTPGWQSMLNATPGTILHFEKPDLYGSTDVCLRYKTPWPLGFVDNGSRHHPTKIHSIRVPQPENASRLFLDDVKILHYGMASLGLQWSKWRMYSVIENVCEPQPFWRRRLAYCSSMDWTKLGQVEQTPDEWFDAWEIMGIDMHTIPGDTYYWQDYEILKYFQKYGARRFWLDDIWNFDWESCRRHANALQIHDVPREKILEPPKLLRVLLKFFDQFLKLTRWFLRGVKTPFQREKSRASGSSFTHFSRQNCESSAQPE